MPKYLKTEMNKDGIYKISLNRPEIHNAFNDEMILEITNEFLEIDNKEEITLIILTGEGRSFCAGADLNWMKSMVGYSENENFEDSKKLAKMFSTINNCLKPIIGVINGHALGGGVGLVSVCDYVITHSKAKFGFTETRLGLIPAVISPYCINKIGESHARAWFLSGEMFSADMAQKMNLIHEVCELDSFEENVNNRISMFLKAGPKAAIEAKKLIKNIFSLEKKQIEDYTCKAISERRVSTEGQEGMNALLEKRKPNWIKND